MVSLVSFREYRKKYAAINGSKSVPDFGPSIAISGNQPRPMNFSRTDLSNPRVIDDINNHLDVKLYEKILTPYIALERIRKTLQPYGIMIPAVAWLNSDEGDYVFPVSQWDNNMETNPDWHVYMSWSYDPQGKSYDIYAAVVSTDQLDELLGTNDDMTAFDAQDVEEDGAE